MKFGEFIKDKTLLIITILLAILSIEILLLAYHIHIMIRVYIAMIVILVLGISILVEYKRKKELHEKLGALGFREIVFKLERLKFKVMKKICPNFVVYYEKWCDFNTKRMIGKAKSSEEAELIELVNKISKLKTKKEWNKEENRNYHIDNKYPTQIINYLNWNKAIHQKNLKNDVVAISLLSLGTYYSLPLMLPLLIVI